MDLLLSNDIAKDYSSRSQKIRVISELWVKNIIYCPNCGCSISSFMNNKPVADFYCVQCSEEFELKSKQGFMGNKIVNGAYTTMIQRLLSNNNPNFFFLTYNNTTLEVKNFLTIPKYFFTPTIIEKRRALNASARRAGWIGCNIVVKDIPEFGKIFYVRNGIANNRDEVLSKWSKTKFIKSTHDIEAKGWTLDVLLCVEGIKKREFSLDDVYAYESLLKSKHPLNKNIKAKIRQQLQFLRDKKVIDFIGRGKYRLIV